MPPCDSGGGSDKGDADLSASTPDERFSTTGLSVYLAVFYLTGFLFFFFLGFNCSYHKDVFRPDLVRFWGNFGLNSIGFL